MQLRLERIGHYSLSRLLGSGGMGEVYLALDEQIKRQVAIKVIRTSSLLEENAKEAQEALRLFKREAQAIARLSHRHILSLYEYDEAMVNTIRLAYMVMPYCADGSLQQWLRQRESANLPPYDVAHLLHQAADALQYAHDHHIIHRDVKPANFLLRKSTESALPDLLLADFGIARIADATVSMSQHAIGTPQYMPPEQWNGEPTYATDQYALAVMGYRMLTGRLPFQGTSAQIMFHHLQTRPEPPGKIVSDVPPALDAVILKALEKDPRQRFERIEEFALAFKQALGNEIPSFPLRADVSPLVASFQPITPQVANPVVSSSLLTDSPSAPDLVKLTSSRRPETTVVTPGRRGEQPSLAYPHFSPARTVKTLFPVLVKRPVTMSILLAAVVIMLIVGSLSFYFIGQPAAQDATVSFKDAVSSASPTTPPTLPTAYGIVPLIPANPSNYDFPGEPVLVRAAPEYLNPTKDCQSTTTNGQLRYHCRVLLQIDNKASGTLLIAEPAGGLCHVYEGNTPTSSDTATSYTVTPGEIVSFSFTMDGKCTDGEALCPGHTIIYNFRIDNDAAVYGNDRFDVTIQC